MDRFSPIWFSRTLGMLALIIVAGMGIAEGDYSLYLMERSTWAMLLAAMAGLLLGNLLKGPLHSYVVPAGHDASQGMQVDAELPGTMPPLAE